MANPIQAAIIIPCHGRKKPTQTIAMPRANMPKNRFVFIIYLIYLKFTIINL